jgi:hypothetical protein
MIKKPLLLIMLLVHKTLVVAFIGEGDVIIQKLFQNNGRCKNYGH